MCSHRQRVCNLTHISHVILTTLADNFSSPSDSPLKPFPSSPPGSFTDFFFFRAFGDVYSANCTADGTVFALKVFKSKFDPTSENSIVREIQAMHQLKNKYIIGFKEAFLWEVRIQPLSFLSSSSFLTPLFLLEHLPLRKLAHCCSGCWSFGCLCFK